MGRKTFDSLPGCRPLKGRLNLILPRSSSFAPPEGAEVFCDLNALLERAAQFPPEHVFVIGGEEIYRLLLPHCRRAYITKVDADPPADRRFPDLDRMPGWLVEQEGAPLEHDGIRFRFVTYRSTMKEKTTGA
jgi:dihydrofolate reductase